jgi:hypothetical protein
MSEHIASAYFLGCPPTIQDRRRSSTRQTTRSVSWTRSEPGTKPPLSKKWHTSAQDGRRSTLSSPDLPQSCCLALSWLAWSTIANSGPGS